MEEKQSLLRGFLTFLSWQLFQTTISSIKANCVLEKQEDSCKKKNSLGRRRPLPLNLRMQDAIPVMTEWWSPRNHPITHPSFWHQPGCITFLKKFVQDPRSLKSYHLFLKCSSSPNIHTPQIQCPLVLLVHHRRAIVFPLTLLPTSQETLIL